MDVVKTRLQAQTQVPKSGSGYNMSAGPIKMRYRGTVDAFVKIVGQEGVIALWRGLGPSVAMTVPSTTIYFALYEFFKSELEDHSKLGYSTPFVAGASARAIAVAATSPIDLFRTNVQSHSREIGATQLFRQIIKSGRWSTFWVGIRPTLWRDVPFSGIYWMCYEALRREITRTRLTKSNYLTSLTAGAIAGSIAGVLTLPFDVLKTRTQMNVDRVATRTLSPDHLPSTTFQHMTQIVSQEGIRALFQGLLPRIGKVAPACAIMISTYEVLKDYFLSKRQPSTIEGIKKLSTQQTDANTLYTTAPNTKTSNPSAKHTHSTTQNSSHLIPSQNNVSTTPLPQKVLGTGRADIP